MSTKNILIDELPFPLSDSSDSELNNHKMNRPVGNRGDARSRVTHTTIDVSEPRPPGTEPDYETNFSNREAMRSAVRPVSPVHNSHVPDFVTEESQRVSFPNTTVGNKITSGEDFSYQQYPSIPIPPAWNQRPQPNQYQSRQFYPPTQTNFSSYYPEGNQGARDYQGRIGTYPPTMGSHDLGYVEQMRKESELVKRENELLQRELQLMQREFKASGNDYRHTVTESRFSPRDVAELIPDYDPIQHNGMSIQRWLELVESYKKLYNLNDLIVMHAAITKLHGIARVWYDSVAMEIRSFVQLKSRLIMEFGKTKNVVEIHQLLNNRKKRSTESFSEYVYDIKHIASDANLNDDVIIQYVIQGINDQDAMKMLSLQRFNSLQQLLEQLKHYESICTFACPRPVTEGKKVTWQPESSTKYEIKTEPTRNIEKMSNSTSNYKSSYKCNRCGSNRHTDSWCRQYGPATKSTNPLTVCEYCRKPGHTVSNCFAKEGIANKSKTEHVRRVHCDEYHKPIMINDVEMIAFVDLGSDVVTIKEEIAEILNVNILPSTSLLRGFANGTSKALGKFQSIVQIDNINIDTEVLVVPDDAQNYDVILGRTALDQPHIMVEKSYKSLIIKSNLVNDTEVVELLRIEQEDEGKKNTESGSEIVSELNECFQQQQTPIISKDESKSGDLPFSHPIIEFNINPLLFQYLEQVKKIINSSRECFAVNMKEIRCTTKTEMTIRLKNYDTPLFQRPYRLSYVQRENVKLHINDLLQQGVIVESFSDYASPIVVVKKKTGEDRICIDYRKLNGQTIKDRYPMPLIDHQLQRLSGNKYFTVMDLASGYYQIPLAKESQHLTSFVTPDGQYEFLRMPFGLSNAPAIFQRIMNRIASEMNNAIIVYLDDIIIPSKTVPEGMVLLSEFLKKIEEYNMSINIKKCHFLQEKVNFLGHEVTEAGIQPGCAKTLAIKEYPQPQTTKEIKQFVGLASYFRKFVPSFAKIAEPLTRLMKQSEPFMWTEEQSTAFDTLKRSLCSGPVLTLYDPHKEHEVHTDACVNGLSGLLLQIDDKGVSLVSCFSRKTTELEQKYHSYELETLAVVETIERFRQYLLGKHFKVITDCNSLKASANKKELIPRIGRWWLKLLEFNFEVIHKPGKRMSHVDALSRNPVEVSKEVAEADLHVLSMEVTDQLEPISDWLVALQNTDKDISFIKEMLQHKTKETENIWSQFSDKHGRIYRCVHGQLKFWIPSGARWKTIHIHHDGKGHYGLRKTLKSLQKLYWFPRMRQTVGKYIASCIDCAYNKKQGGSDRIRLHPIEKGETPCHTLHIDHLGPFPTSRRKNTHVFVIIDGFTKYIQLKAVTSTGTLPAIKSIQEFARHFGVPNRIVSDRGTAFTSKNFESFCIENNIKHILNATATPRANGQVERYNRTILNALTTLMHNEDDTNWDTYLPQVQWSLNSLANDTTKETPQYLMFGFYPRPIQGDKLALELHQSEYLTSDKREELRKIASARVVANQNYQQTRFNLKHSAPYKFQVNDLVMAGREAVSTGGSRKLQPKYRGPLIITHTLHGDRYIVEDLPGNRQTGRRFKGIFAADRLKLCKPVEDEFFEDVIEEQTEDDPGGTVVTYRTQ